MALALAACLFVCKSEPKEIPRFTRTFLFLFAFFALRFAFCVFPLQLLFCFYKLFSCLMIMLFSNSLSTFPTCAALLHLTAVFNVYHYMINNKKKTIKITTNVRRKSQCKQRSIHTYIQLLTNDFESKERELLAPWLACMYVCVIRHRTTCKHTYIHTFIYKRTCIPHTQHANIHIFCICCDNKLETRDGHVTA